PDRRLGGEFERRYRDPVQQPDRGAAGLRRERQGGHHGGPTAANHDQHDPIGHVGGPRAALAAMSLAGALSSASGGLANVSAQLALVSHNVANASTPSYAVESIDSQSRTSDG